jgi:hypothetical protein
MKVGIYSPLTPLPSLVGNGYIIYLLLILMALNGTATAIGTPMEFHGSLPLQFFFCGDSGGNAPRILSLVV